jgi:putative aldouronate transport system permease protein
MTEKTLRIDKIKSNLKYKWFDYLNVGGMAVLIFITLFPFWTILVGSFNEGFDYIKGGVYFWPRKFSLDNYRVVFMDKTILGAYKITILRTVIGVTSHLFFTSIFAYAYSRKNLKWKKLYMIIGLITMYFNGGLIPKYILYKELHLLDNFWVYILPNMFGFFHVIIMQAFFRTIPDAISESAMMDGANEYRIYWSLILPLAKPVLAAVALFSGVFHWNSYFDSMVFTTSKDLQTIQVYLMKIIRSQNFAAEMASNATVNSLISNQEKLNSATIQLATMIATTVPILVLYPFLQKYFVKGIMIGSIKG